MLKVPIKSYVYGKRQTSDSSWEFLKIEIDRLKTAQKIVTDKTNVELLILGVEQSSKAKVDGKLGHVVQIHVCR